MSFTGVDILLAAALGLALIYAFKLFTGDKTPDAVKKPASISGSASKSTSASANSTDKPSVTILFGSQSGTAENYAYDLAEEGKTQGFNTKVVDLEEFSPHDLAVEPLVVFVVATFGEGEPTDNAASFWEYICTDKNERDFNEFSNTFSVFALGNRQYRHFCAVGKKIDIELAGMGGERLLPLGLGDDDGTLEEDFETWRANFWAAARLKFLKSAGGESVGAVVFNSSYDVTMFPAESAQATSYVSNDLTKVARFFNDPAKEHKTAVVRVVESKELRQDPTGLESTVHVELDLTDSKLTYRTADNLGIHPRNDYALAGKLAKRIGVNMSQVFTLKTKSTRKVHIPSTCSVQDCFLYYLDINSCPRGKFAAIFATYASDAKEKAKLVYYANDVEGKELFHELKYNWFELLEAFPSIDIPFSHFIELVPRLQQRFYTIASSSKVQPKQAAITVSRLFGSKPDNREHIGVCSDLVCKTVADEKNRELVVFVRPSSFRLPIRSGTPIIMIGPGTGLAPFRGFIQEFRTRKDEHKYGDTVLYFGCRNSEKDYIYKEELEQAHADGVLTQLNVALSRQPGQDKVYVQDLLKNNAAKTWELIEKGAYIFVCGGTLMGRDILNVFINICATEGKMTDAAAEAFVDKMIRANRYVQELWSA